MPPLLAPGARRAAVISAVSGVVVLVVLGIVHGGRGPGLLDRLVSDVLDGHQGFFRALAVLSEPLVTASVTAAVTVFALARRRWNLAVLAVAAPLVAAALVTWVLKPLFDRPLHDYLAYPSGHTATAVAAAAVLGVAARSALVVVVASVLVAVPITGAGYHYATDTIGAIGLAVALVVGLAVGVDRVIDTIGARRLHPNQ